MSLGLAPPKDALAPKGTHSLVLALTICFDYWKLLWAEYLCPLQTLYVETLIPTLGVSMTLSLWGMKRKESGPPGFCCRGHAKSCW